MILGTDLTGATGVSFNGRRGRIQGGLENPDLSQVPSGATTGFVTVHTPSGTLKSNVKFQVS